MSSTEKGIIMNIKINSEILREIAEMKAAMESGSKWRKIRAVCNPRYEAVMFIETGMWRTSEGWRLMRQLVWDNIRIAKAIMEGKI